jgi:hypothetical protein
VVSHTTIEAHFTKLDKQRTLDTKHVLQYTGWGVHNVQLSSKEREVCRFLRSVEMGGGASTGSSRASLNYARSLGGRGGRLPKTVRTCWKVVAKVNNAVTFVVTFILYVHLQRSL